MRDTVQALKEAMLARILGALPRTSRSKRRTAMQMRLLVKTANATKQQTVHVFRDWHTREEFTHPRCMALPERVAVGGNMLADVSRGSWCAVR